ncbi:MAG TPA: (Fe-S)-binding protein, partial [Actinomycetota bacterium]|nr:(Fe-S)-binding protein [Actinomycetota bacterium]
LYDYGMLDLAKHLLRQVLDELRPYLRAGTAVVGIEPSCVAVFRDELPNLFPHDRDARRLAGQARMLEEFLVDEGWRPPPLRGKAVVHGHCHHKAIMGLDAEAELLDAMGLNHELPATGCCGMAGSFGFEAGEKYEVGKAAGERVLLPAVREAAEDTLIVADGFSCRTMIEQETDRRALHVAEVLRMAMDGQAPGRARPEDALGDEATVGDGRPPPGRGVAAGALAAAAGAAAWGLARRSRGRLRSRAAG